MSMIVLTTEIVLSSLGTYMYGWLTMSGFATMSLGDASPETTVISPKLAAGSTTVTVPRLSLTDHTRPEESIANPPELPVLFVRFAK